MGINKKTYIVANWKMHFTPGEASIYLHKLADKVRPSRDLQMILAPSTIALQSLSLQVNRRQFKLAAQNFYWQDFGAYTGETAVAQLRGIVDYAIVGHSERRHIFGETDKDIRRKVAAAIRNGIIPILCIGETADERAYGETDAVIYDQLLGGLSDVSKEDIDKIIIAYEPVWAISSTKDAKIAAPADIEDAIARIRKHVTHLYGKANADAMPILYGGSVSESNAKAYLEAKGVDGLLIGSASLILDRFDSIVEAARSIHHE